MNHDREVYITNHTTLDLGHREFAVRVRYSLRLGVYSSDLSLGSIFAIYTKYISLGSSRRKSLIQISESPNGIHAVHLLTISVV